MILDEELCVICTDEIGLDSHHSPMPYRILPDGGAVHEVCVLQEERDFARGEVGRWFEEVERLRAALSQITRVGPFRGRAAAIEIALKALAAGPFMGSPCT